MAQEQEVQGRVFRLCGHYDGRQITIIDPLPAELRPGPIEVVIIDRRPEILAEMNAFWKELWSRPLPPDFVPQGRTWKREDLYDRGYGKREPKSDESEEPQQ